MSKTNESDMHKWGRCKMNNAAGDIRNAHPVPNRKARRMMAAQARSVRTRQASYNNHNLLPPGAVHFYAQ